MEDLEKWHNIEFYERTNHCNFFCNKTESIKSLSDLLAGKWVWNPDWISTVVEMWRTGKGRLRLATSKIVSDDGTRIRDLPSLSSLANSAYGLHRVSLRFQCNNVYNVSQPGLRKSHAACQAAPKKWLAGSQTPLDAIRWCVVMFGGAPFGLCANKPNTKHSNSILECDITIERPNWIKKSKSDTIHFRGALSY